MSSQTVNQGLAKIASRFHIYRVLADGTGELAWSCGRRIDALKAAPNYVEPGVSVEVYDTMSKRADRYPIARVTAERGGWTMVHGKRVSVGGKL